MTEKRIALKPIEAHRYCDCGGEFAFEGVVLTTSYPAQYPHSCKKCGAKANFGKVYPCIEYEKANRKKENEK